MALDNPFLVYGYLYEGSTGSWTGLDGRYVEVWAQGSSVSGLTAGGGYYQVNIQTIATDGDTIGISGQNDIDTSGATYVLDVTDLSYQQDLHLEDGGDGGSGEITGDLRIYYSSLSDPDYIKCWCNRWDQNDWNIVVETFLDKSDLQTLTNNITPGAVGELYEVLGSRIHYDQTWAGENTLKLVPNPTFTKSELNKMREDTIIYVKNISSTPFEGTSGFLDVKIEGIVSGGTL
jgi:hypothetical protein